MIFIDRGTCPTALARKGASGRVLLEQEYLAHKRKYRRKPLKVKATYRLRTVVNTLLRKQHNKCCFSEAKFCGDYPHVEHFRCKGPVDEWPSGSRLYPGYYWLAYEWSNLLLCKSLINSSFKRNFFPLIDESQRNRSHLEVNVERPILIDPASEDPRDHIIFIGTVPVGKTDRGRMTIEILGLDHSDFEEGRTRKLAELKALTLLIKMGMKFGLPQSEVEGSLKILKDAKSSKAEFSSMAIDFLSKEFPDL